MYLTRTPAVIRRAPFHYSLSFLIFPVTHSTVFRFPYTMVRLNVLSTALLLTGCTLAVPVQNAELTITTSKAECDGQSCLNADLSGSTGHLPKFKPQGGDANGYKCIARYNAKGVEAAKNAPAGPKQSTGFSGALTGGIASIGSATSLLSPPKDKGTFSGKCTKNILFFARGTTEPGVVGISVGPVLRSALAGRDFAVVGVPYDADFAGDNCLGLPGGMVARDMINQAAEKCPDSKIFMSGYSEGGMVSHNAVAYASAEAKEKVAAVITFGVSFCLLYTKNSPRVSNGREI